MKKKTYVYKLTSKYRKKPELLMNYGFSYFENEEQDVGVFAYPVVLKQDNPLFIQGVRFFEHIYSEATSEERAKDFEGYQFKKELQEDQHNVDRLVLTKDVIKEFSQAQICVSVRKNDTDRTLLFVNSPLQNTYYHYKTIYDCAPELIDKMLKDKVIYERRYLYDTRRQKSN